MIRFNKVQSTIVLQKANLKIMKFSYNGTMLQTNVTHCSYITRQYFAPRNIVVNSTCYTMVLHYGVMLHVSTRLKMNFFF